MERITRVTDVRRFDAIRVTGDHPLAGRVAVVTDLDWRIRRGQSGDVYACDLALTVPPGPDATDAAGWLSGMLEDRLTSDVVVVVGAWDPGSRTVVQKTA